MSKETANKMVELGAKGRQAWKEGKIPEAENYFLQLWDILPTPKESDDQSQGASTGMVEFYRQTQQFEKAEHWLDVAKKMYMTNGTLSEASISTINFLAGTVFYEWGKEDQAFALFDPLFKKYKQRMFQGEDKKYLDFYLKRAKKK
jgi:hypothetical protein